MYQTPNALVGNFNQFLPSDGQAATLVSLHPRINLSPFTKDFRGGEQLNES